MSSSDQPTDSTGKVLGGVGIAIGVIIALGLCVVLAACLTIFMLALMGPAIGNVFSGIILEI